MRVRSGMTLRMGPGSIHPAVHCGRGVSRRRPGLALRQAARCLESDITTPEFDVAIPCRAKSVEGTEVIVWRGWGVLALLIAAAGGGLGTGLGVALGGATDHANVGTGVGLMVAAVVIWIVGKRMNAPRLGFDSITGQPVVYRNQHALLFIPMQFWGPIAGAAGIAALIIGLAS